MLILSMFTETNKKEKSVEVTQSHRQTHMQTQANAWKKREKKREYDCEAYHIYSINVHTLVSANTQHINTNNKWGNGFWENVQSIRFRTNRQHESQTARERLNVNEEKRNGITSNM